MDSNGVPIPKNPKYVSCHSFEIKVFGKMNIVQTKYEAWLKLKLKFRIPYIVGAKEVWIFFNYEVPLQKFLKKYLL